jgi:CRISPR-associated endonuclease/helicase Cas3
MPLDPNKLWAKSRRDGEPERPSLFLRGHLEDAHQAAMRVIDATSDDQLTALGLRSGAYGDRLRRCVLLAAAVHDLGKANDHFQGMIRGTRNVQQNPQGLRHEWVTVLILKGLRCCLLPAVGGSEEDFAAVEWAVAGHHPAHHHESPPRLCPAGAGADLEVLTGHADFPPILAWLGRTFHLPTDPPATPSARRRLVGANNVFAELAGWARDAQRKWETFDPTARRFVAAVKNCLIAADVAGSALPKELPNDPDRWRWVTDSFAARPEPPDLDAVVDHRLKGERPREFQNAVAASADPVTYVRAGCGTGKTLAAYMWARDRHPGRRIYFCYPTTGTATEGFRDYLFPPEAEPGTDDDCAGRVRAIGARLFHSRRDVDFEIILNTGPDTRSPEADAVARVESLEAWSTPVVACTVDTVLGLVQNNRRGLFAWPALAGAAFVFDEIHAYDDRLFGALLRFLRDLPGLPALLMTASLPKAREEALRNTLQRCRGVELQPIAGPAPQEALPRYHKAVAKDNDPLPLVEKALTDGGKVLWVCNTVGRVIEAADRTGMLGPRIYHSRFKYEDRVRRHQDVIDAFNPERNRGQALAICSQVAEMSLDLSAALLVTDLATVPALIQRLGRLNRRSTPEKPMSPMPFVVVEPENHLPYTPADLESARAWLARLPDQGISQRHLAELWEQSADNPPDLVPSAWLDGGPTTTVTELREASPGVTVLMEEDVRRVKERPKDLARLVLPMPPPPRSLNWQGWRKEHGLPVAPAGTLDYNPNRGAEWRK